MPNTSNLYPITNRAQFIQYGLRALGAPAINIEVLPEQIEDRINEALNYWADFYYEGFTQIVYPYLLQPNDITNKFIPVNDPDIISVVKMFEFNGDTSIFNLNYQIRINDFDMFYGSLGSAAQPYYILNQHIALLDFMFNVKYDVNFSRYDNKIYINWVWGTDCVAGQYVNFLCYRAMNPDSYPKVWNDRWLKEYFVQLLKRQWATNLRKYNDVKLVGGTSLNVEKMYAESDLRIQQLQQELLSDSGPFGFVMG